MSDIKHRLRASVRMDAVHGDTHERSVCARQMVEAANEIERLTAERDELRRQLAEAEQDARRYQWLRTQPNDASAPRIDVVYWTPADESANDGEGLRLTELDAAIDAAMGLPRPAEE